MDRLLELLPVSRELLDTGFTLQVPQTNRAVMTCRELEGTEGVKCDKKRSIFKIWKISDSVFMGPSLPD